jgi:PEP-CTERM motif
MKSTLKNALALAAALAACTSVRAASGDLLVGFYQSGAPNTVIYDIGSLGSLYEGETWSLGSTLSGAGFLNGAIGVSYGVVGYNSGSQTIFTTTDGSFRPDLSQSDFQSTKYAVDTIAINNPTQAVGSGPDWFSETVNQVGTSTTTYIAVTGVNPNTTQPGIAYLYAAKFDGSAADSFKFSLANDGTLTVVPEPASLSLLAGFGFLAFALRQRRQFSRKA